MRRNSALALTVVLALSAAGCALEPDASLIGTVSDPLRPATVPTLPPYPNIAQAPVDSMAPVSLDPNAPEQPAVSAVLDEAARQKTIEEMAAMAGRGQVRGPRTSTAELRRIQTGHGAAALADIERR